MPLTIEQIRAVHKSLPRREVETPDLGGSVWVRGLTLKEVREVQSLQARAKDTPTDVSKKLVELAACNEDGSPLFVGEDKALVEGLTWGTVEAISEAALGLSGLKPGAEDDARKN